MNCKHVQELLPLYTGRDLDEKRARLVAAHVLKCTACARVSREYQQASQLTQEFATPVFGDDVYAGIRRRVLREIEIDSAATPRQMFFGWLRPSFRWAFATAVVIAVIGLAFYFVSVRQPTSTQVAEGQPVNRNDGGQSAPTRVNPSPERASSPETGSSPHWTPRRRTPPKNRNVLVASKMRETPARAEEVAPVWRDPRETNALPNDDANPADPTMRMEIQTRDPNIRIIWFGGREGK